MANRSDPPDVFILTFCKNIDQLYGSLLVFKTLRDGFPHATVSVCDNASIPDAVCEIKRAAQVTGCLFHQFQHEVLHPDFLLACLSNGTSQRVVFLDPDVVFWKSVEDWEFEGLVAGRRIPLFFDEYTQCVTVPRLHTSMLFVQDRKRLRHHIAEIQHLRFDFHPFRPVMVPQGKTWVRYDTGATLFHAMPEEMQPFRHEHLESYDHLFCGTHFDHVRQFISPTDRATWQALHDGVQKDYRCLKGAWETQEAYFRSRAVPIDASS